jgi:hypothetical protein
MLLKQNINFTDRIFDRQKIPLVMGQTQRVNEASHSVDTVFSTMK